MLNSEPLALYVDDCAESYLVWRKQAIDVHFLLGTQRLLELQNQSECVCAGSSAVWPYPVSRMTLNCEKMSQRSKVASRCVLTV